MNAELAHMIAVRRHIACMEQRDGSPRASWWRQQVRQIIAWERRTREVMR